MTQCGADIAATSAQIPMQAEPKELWPSQPKGSNSVLFILS